MKFRLTLTDVRHAFSPKSLSGSTGSRASATAFPIQFHDLEALATVLDQRVDNPIGVTTPSPAPLASLRASLFGVGYPVARPPLAVIEDPSPTSKWSPTFFFFPLVSLLFCEDEEVCPLPAGLISQLLKELDLILFLISGVSWIGYIQWHIQLIVKIFLETDWSTSKYLG